MLKYSNRAVSNIQAYLATILLYSVLQYGKACLTLRKGLEYFNKVVKTVILI